MAEIKPAEVFHPGEILLDELNARGWSQVEFAEIVGRPYQVINEIIKGRKRVTPETAKEFSAALGTTPEFWLNLDSAYHLWKTEEASPKISERAKMRTKYHVRDMMLRKWLEPSEDTRVIENQLLRYFEIKSLDETPALAFVAKRSGNENEGLNPAQLAWLYRVKHIAKNMDVNHFSSEKLRETVEQLQLFRQEPEDIGNIPRLLEESGVRFVIVEPLVSSNIDGVCFWLGNSPVIGLTLRFDRIDNFWFVLRHEIEHVLNGDGKDRAILDIEVMEMQGVADLSKQEQAANLAAAEFSVPQDELTEFINRKAPYISRKDVTSFAQRLGIHPGLVVGQIHWKIKRYDLFRSLLISVKELIGPFSTTDGYGRYIPIQI